MLVASKEEKMVMNLPRIGITMGDPTGIGPEIKEVTIR
jgi:4-hydroxy-L-threonine phosphate dehydrogenase PdxA